MIDKIAFSVKLRTRLKRHRAEFASVLGEVIMQIMPQHRKSILYILSAS